MQSRWSEAIVGGAVHYRGGRWCGDGGRRYDCDVLVIGGGIVGLSTAYAITRAAPGTRVIVLEKEPGPARHQTGRNSGVIHSGIYYRPGSLKARFAVRGAAEMVKFCAEYGIAARGHGQADRRHRTAPSCRGCTPWSSAAGRTAFRCASWARPRSAEYEPEVRGPRRDPCRHDRGLRLRRGGGAAGATASGADDPLRRARSTAIDRRALRGRRAHGGRRRCVRARALVNCAGLHCDRVARLAGDDPGMRIVPFRGEYYELARPGAGPRPGLPGAGPGVPVPRRASDPRHRRRRPRRPERGARRWPARATAGRTVRPRELAGDAGLARAPGGSPRRHWRYGAGELHRSLSKRAFTEAVRRLLPAVTEADLLPRAGRGARPGGAAGRHAGGRLPDPRGPAHGPRPERPVPGGDGLAPDRPRGGPPGADRAGGGRPARAAP